jgi:alkanesulfonate monooxygenase SsuD/methylene tetrahydromethanopterin reductase-like flavin-dependent oxidoreductase (luciferase family)
MSQPDRSVTFGLAVPAGLADPMVAGPSASEWCGLLEAGNVSALWTVDQLSGSFPTAEPLALLAYLAGLTTRVRLGVAVLVGPSRGPLAAAKALATIDRLSGGRLDVGLGLGAPRHYPAYGLDPDRHGAGTFLDELLRLLPLLWSGRSVDDAGEVWPLDGVRLTPGPVQRPHPPLWIGGAGPRARRRALTAASGWIGAGRHTAVEFSAELARLHDDLAATGRPVDDLRIAKRAYVHLGGTDAAADRHTVEAFFERFYGRPELGAAVTITGTADDCAAGLADLAARGAGHLIVHLVDDRPGTVARVLHDVLPRVSPTLAA